MVEERSSGGGGALIGWRRNAHIPMETRRLAWGRGDVASLRPTWVALLDDSVGLPARRRPALRTRLGGPPPSVGELTGASGWPSVEVSQASRRGTWLSKCWDIAKRRFPVFREE